MKKKPAPASAFHVDGLRVLVEESHALPLVDVEIVVRTGTLAEPLGKEGVARLVARMCRMGTAKLRGHEVEERVASLGARLGVDVGTTLLRFQGTVIRKNLEPFFALLASIVFEPAFRTSDLAHVKRETEAERIAGFDSDRLLAGRHFRAALFGSHPFGRSAIGTRKSVRTVATVDLRAFHGKHLVRDSVVVGFAGDIDAGTAESLVAKYLAAVPRGKRSPLRVPEPKQPKGLCVRIVDKPDRTQTQILAGTLGSHLGDPYTFPLLVANTAFGGMFSGRLMHEVRTKRGYSYGASSRVGQDVRREAWTMGAFPSAEHTVACASLMLDLYRAWIDKGPSGREVAAAKRYLVNGRCFEEDTAEKRLDARMDVELYGLPEDHYTRFSAHVRGVTRDAAAEAIAERLSTKNVVLVVVATASEVRAGFEAMPGVRSVEVVPFDVEAS